MKNSDINIRPLSHFYNMPLYESGESVIRGNENAVKLSANENMHGPCNEVSISLHITLKTFSSIQIVIILLYDVKSARYMI